MSARKNDSGKPHTAITLAHPKFGDPMLPERFWDKVHPEPSTGCWLWTGCTVKGYGQLTWKDRRKKYAHRLVLGLSCSTHFVVDHLCGVKCCVNPAHLELVSSRENLLRGDTAASRNVVKTTCVRGHLLAGENVYTHNRKRYCNKCRQVRRMESKL